MTDVSFVYKKKLRLKDGMILAELYDNRVKSMKPNGSTLNGGIYAIVEDYKNFGKLSVKTFRNAKYFHDAIVSVQKQDRLVIWADLSGKMPEGQWWFIIARKYVNPKKIKE